MTLAEFNDKEIGISKFILEKEKALKDFFAFWIKQNRKTPEEYPHGMLPGEWDEQFEIFQGSTDGD